MLMTPDEIKAEIASGGITAISLDTSIFEKSRNRFEHAPLSQLKQFVGSRVQFLVTDVVAGEVKAHVVRDGKEAELAVRAALRKTGEKWQTTREARDALMVGLLGGETAEAMGERRFKAFKDVTGLSIVQSEPLVSLSRVLNDYFLARPPFGTNAVKKSEFPDAIALHALENWAMRESTKILVVAKDGDWKNYCDISPTLVLVDELGDALSLFHQDATVVCSLISAGISNKSIDFEEKLSMALQYAAEYLDFIPEASAAYYYEPDVEFVEVEGFEFIPIQHRGEVFLKPVDHNARRLVAEALVRVAIAVTTSFSFSAKDPIDRDEVPIGSASVKKSFELMAKVFVTFEGDLASSPEVLEVEAEFEGRHCDIDYGAVEPDWQDYEE